MKRTQPGCQRPGGSLSGSLSAQRSDRHMVGPDAPLTGRWGWGCGGGESCGLATARAALNSQSSSDVGGTSKGFGEKARGDRVQQKVSAGVPGRKLATEMTKNLTRLNVLLLVLSNQSGIQNNLTIYLETGVFSPLFDHLLQNAP